ncbi:Disease resistance protein RGA2, putative [Ricinus communis]|uniref:Disease resistance protein RGA2, putative n=1 Tax=Ricinus communis TaxID=3988 RepID=B9SDB4_RICCO|nr:Disease resistance protein RGA2, putative [Ricinus communis]
MGDAYLSLINPLSSQILALVTSLTKDGYDLLQGVKAAAAKLSSNLTAIEAMLKTAEEKQLEETHLSDWLGKLKIAVWDVEDVLETFETDVSLWKRKQEVCGFKSPFSLSKTSFEYDAANRIKTVTSKLGLIAEEKRFQLDVNVDVRRPLKKLPTSSSSVETACVFGREDDKENIVDLLLSDESDQQKNVSLFPIVGMGGLGKTTLARLVYDDSRVVKHFELRMWVPVTIDFNLTEIMREMMHLGSDLSPSLVELRCREFLRGKRFFLVLDDVWSVDYNDDWKPLLQLLEIAQFGSKVLVTTQNQKIAEIIETQPAYLLDCLPENECWSLFKSIAFRGGNLPSLVQNDLENIGREILSKCNGLPLAVKGMGNILRGNVDISNWQKVMNSSVMDLENSKNSLNILATIKWSYYYLPSHLKQCFAYCSIFPKGYKFDKKELVKLWMAQGFIHSEQERTEKIGMEYFDELLASAEIKLHDQAAEEILENMVPHTNIKELQICNYTGTGFPTWMRDGLLQNLVIVTLKHCTKSKTLTLGQLPHLEALNMEGLLALEEWPTVRCPSLDRLKICNCPELRKLPDIFHKLRTLEIRRCNSLKVLPEAPCLKSLMAVDNPNLEDQNEVMLPSESEGEISSLLKLVDLRIENCPKLSALPGVSKRAGDKQV